MSGPIRFDVLYGFAVIQPATRRELDLLCVEAADPEMTRCAFCGKDRKSGSVIPCDGCGATSAVPTKDE